MTIPALEPAPWNATSTTAVDCTLHQLAPYIGRAKTTIARYLVETYTERNDLVVDPFCGSGVIPLEASLRGRRALACDINPYGALLTRAKLGPPSDEARGIARLHERWAGATARIPAQDLRCVPLWVRRFFHLGTLRHALALRDELVEKKDWFLLACLLGILHHQRPGFLSYPSSHLVPYLRDKLFPRTAHPTMYEERDVLSRMEAKVRRTFRRPAASLAESRVELRDSRALRLSAEVNAVITSPPYMNELDYVRDNRLRLWFLLRSLPAHHDIPKRDREETFRALMTSTLSRLAPFVVHDGVIVLIVGDASRGSRRLDGADVIREAFRSEAALSGFSLERRIGDAIPDIRRSRRDLRGTKSETVLVFRRVSSAQRVRPAHRSKL
jgi:DNA methylase